MKHYHFILIYLAVFPFWLTVVCFVMGEFDVFSMDAGARFFIALFSILSWVFSAMAHFFAFDVEVLKKRLELYE